MIARTWRGWVRTEQAGGLRRVHHQHRPESIREDTRQPGCPDVDDRLRRRPDRSHDGQLVVIRTDIEGFAGQNIDVAVFYPDDDDYLIDREPTVRHYDVARTL